MKRARWVCWTVSLLVGAAALFATQRAVAMDDEVPTQMPVLLNSAVVTLQAAGAAALAPLPLVLPHRWDKSYPGQNGHALYQMVLPPMSSREPFALFIPRVGNQVEVRVGGKVVAKLGVLNNPSSDSAKGPVWITIPSAMVSPVEPTALEVEVTVQSDRWGGLSSVHFGPESMLRPGWNSNYHWRQTASVVIVLALALMGVIAAGLWWRQSDTTGGLPGHQHNQGLYGMFALIAVTGIVRMGDRLLPVPPLPWPLWGGITAGAYAAHLLLMARFALETVGERQRWVRRGFWIYLVAAVLAAFAAFLFHWPRLWTWTLESLLLPGVVVLYKVARQAWRHPTRENRLMAVAAVVVILAGVRDLVQVRIADGGSLTFSILPHAVFVLVMVMGWIIVERYSEQVNQYRDLNTTLAQRIAQREQELGLSHDRLKLQGEQQATLQERQRIMRDIHDGVGAQLVGLLSLLKKSGGKQVAPREQALQEHVTAALDELRMAVDSLQPVHGDLLTVLATLRYRIQPRLDAAGLKLIWDVQELPIQDNLIPGTVLQIQRILLEAMTNILRHANAGEVRVTARKIDQPDRLMLQIDDDGIGLPVLRAAHGHGLENMRVRARAIGATLSLAALPGKGTRVQLEMPLQ